MAAVAMVPVTNLFQRLAWAGAEMQKQRIDPANRYGSAVMSVGQLKVLQEVITLTVFVPFAMLFMGGTLKLDYLWAALCLVAAAYFMFRDGAS